MVRRSGLWLLILMFAGMGQLSWGSEQAAAAAASAPACEPGSRGSGFSGVADVPDANNSSNEKSGADQKQQGRGHPPVVICDLDDFQREKAIKQMGQAGMSPHAIILGGQGIDCSNVFQHHNHNYERGSTLVFNETLVNLNKGFFSEAWRVARENAIRGVCSAPLTVVNSFWHQMGSALGQTLAELFMIKCARLFSRQPKESVENSEDIKMLMTMQKVQADAQAQLVKQGEAIENLRKQLEGYTAVTPEEKENLEGMQIMYKSLVTKHAAEMYHVMVLVPRLQQQQMMKDQAEAEAKTNGTAQASSKTDAEKQLKEVKK